MAREKQKAAKENPVEPAEPVDVVDGLADHSRNPAAWKYMLLAAIFILWVALLIWALAVGSGI